MTQESIAYVRTEMLAAQPAPASTRGAVGWARENLFSSPLNALLTLIGALAVSWVIWTILRFGVFDAVFTGTSGADCRTALQNGNLGDREHVGACWPYVGAYLDSFIYGRYPIDQRWRVDIFFLLTAISVVWTLVPSIPYKGLGAAFFLLAYPVASVILLTGGNLGFGAGAYIIAAAVFGFFLFMALLPLISGNEKLADRMGALRNALIIGAGLAVIIFLFNADFGLSRVETPQWGGLLVTLVIAITGIVASLPLGILFALGRRSAMPAIRLISVIFIEFWRGVPLITVLFMSSVMLPLFLPEGVTFDKLLRALIGVALFSAAYMAEVIRGGLQAIPKGQYEGAMSLGLSYWQMMRMIILPQALKLVIPGIVNTFIGLFKDTTLVLIIGLFDFLGTIQSSYTDPTWASPVQNHTGYFFAAMVYFLFCFSMSRYSLYTERRLHTGHKR